MIDAQLHDLSLRMVVLSKYIGMGMVRIIIPSIIDLLGYDREFCSSSSSSDSTRVTQKHNDIIIVMKFCKNVDIRHPKRLVILISLQATTNSPRQYIIMESHLSV